MHEKNQYTYTYVNINQIEIYNTSGEPRLAYDALSLLCIEERVG